MISVSVHVPEMGDLLPSDAAIGTALELVGAKYLQLQTERVGAGLAVDGSAMRPYSPSYLDRKTRAGRAGESYLYLTGKMLRSQRVKVSGGNRGRWRMSVGFTGTRARSRFKSTFAAKKQGILERASRSKRAMAIAEFERQRARQLARAGRSRYGFVAGKQRAEEQRLAVVDQGGSRVSNAYMAAMNDRWRPFVGVSREEANALTRVFITGLRRK